MDEKPTTADPRAKPRRRWYQYSLRTLLIGVALLSLPCAYVAHEYRIVAARQAWIDAHPYAAVVPGFLDPDVRAAHRRDDPSLIRRWLGDESQELLFVRPADADAAAALFPEAEINDTTAE